jgi:flagellar hook assembly protein FlgD
VSEGITSVELYIINRQGELIHSDRTEEISYGTPILKWDGKVGGTNIPTGTYVVVLIGKNPLYQFEEKIIGSLLVLD